jgi:hypothetical protein
MRIVVLGPLHDVQQRSRLLLRLFEQGCECPRELFAGSRGWRTMATNPSAILASHSGGRPSERHRYPGRLTELVTNVRPAQSKGGCRSGQCPGQRAWQAARWPGRALVRCDASRLSASPSGATSPGDLHRPILDEPRPGSAGFLCGRAGRLVGQPVAVR